MSDLNDKTTVAQIAHLARLNLTDQELEVLAKDMQSILDYVNKLSVLNVEGVEPTSHVLPLQNVFRGDAVKPSLPQSQALSIAVEKQSGFFKVSQIIE